MRNYCRAMPVSGPHQASNSPVRRQPKGPSAGRQAPDRSFRPFRSSVMSKSDQNPLFRGFLPEFFETLVRPYYR